MRVRTLPWLWALPCALMSSCGSPDDARHAWPWPAGETPPAVEEAPPSEEGSHDPDMKAPPGDPPPPETPKFAFGPCDSGKWCWENPLPQGNQINDVWGLSATDIWAVGGAGTILHYDGSSWGVMANPPTGQNLLAVWAASATDAWAAGTGGAVVHWNGTSWTSVSSGVTEDLAFIWGSGASDVWIAARTSRLPDPRGFNDLTFFHWDGTRLANVQVTAPPVSTTKLFDFWGCSANEAYAVGTNGRAQAFKWDGLKWNMGMGDSNTTYVGTWCSGPGAKAWRATRGCSTGVSCYVSVEGAGTKWSRRDSDLSGFTAGRDSDVWAQVTGYLGNPHLIAHWNGTSWEELPYSVGIPGFIDSASAHWKWGSTTGANVFRRATAMDPWVSSLQGTTVQLRGVWGRGGDKLWAVGDAGTLLARGSGGSWSAMTSPTTKRLNAIWGSRADQMWAVGDGGTMLSGNGTRWRLLTSGVTEELLALSGTSATDVWAIGRKAILHWDGSGWSQLSATLGGTAISAVTTGDAWLVHDTQVLRFDGTSWNGVMIGASDTWKGVYAATPNDVWLVGKSDFYHFDGTKFTKVPSGGYTLTGPIAGSSPTDVWARATSPDGAFMLHWDGTAWSANPSVTSQPLHGIVSTWPGEAWAVGAGGSIIGLTP